MENVKPGLKVLSDPPVWRVRDGIRPEFAEIEYKRLRIAIYRRPGRTGWYATAHPIMHMTPLRAVLLEDAQREALVALRDRLTALVLKLDIIERVAYP